MEYKRRTKSFVIKEQIEDGYSLLELPNPGLITVLSEATKPRHMNVGAIVDVFWKTDWNLDIRMILK